MPSVVELVNRSLDLLGYSPITSLLDGNKAANLASRMWPFVRDEVLRDHPWNFAVARATTSPEAVTPDWGYNYQHLLPSDCLRLIEVKDMKDEDYELEDNKVLADEDTLRIRYIKCVEDPTQYDSLFIRAVTYRLAHDLSEGLPNARNKKDEFESRYEKYLARATLIDAQENPATNLETDHWIEVRY